VEGRVMMALHILLLLVFTFGFTWWLMRMIYPSNRREERRFIEECAKLSRAAMAKKAEPDLLR
jgi:hypothetical protein